MADKMPDSKVGSSSLLTITKTYYAEYGRHTIEQRALADYRDGLKPVSRRVLWAAGPGPGHLNLTPSGPFKKAARLVGETMGKYHPHGDAAIYGAVVSMVEGIPIRLIQGQGNWGGATDNAAAMRYCFAAETLVSTQHGMVEISEVPEILRLNAQDQDRLSINMKVESLLGPVTATAWLRSGVRRLFTVVTPFTKVRATSNEPFRVLNANMELEWRKLSDLNVGDLVCYHRNPKIKWSKGGVTLKYVPPSLKEKPIEFPKTMTAELAEWFGLLISEGNVQKHCIGFTNTDRKLVARFTKLTRKLFANAHPSINWREPEGWAVQPYAQVSINSQHLSRWLAANGCVPCRADGKCIPPSILRGNKEEMVAFLSNLFEGDGSNSGGVFYSSKSMKLLDQLQTVLITRFGLPFRRAPDKAIGRIYMTGTELYQKYMSEIGFVSMRKSVIAPKLAYSNTTVDFLDALRTLIKSSGTLDRQHNMLLDEHGNKLSCFSYAGLALSNPPLRWPDLKVWFAGCQQVLKLHFPSVHDKVKALLDADYFFAPVQAVVKGLKEMTFDLSVPGTNAYTANGMVVHNTECRVSKYGWECMFDSNYLQTISDKLIPNYDGSEKEPYYLPAKLPNLLINGTYGIATGVTGIIPPVTLESLMPAFNRHLEGRELNAKFLKKTLQFNHVYGGVNSSTEEQMDSFINDGIGVLGFEGRMHLDHNTRTITVYEIPPMCNWDVVVRRLNNHKVLSKYISDYSDDVSKKERKEKGSRAVRFMVKLKNTVPRDDFSQYAQMVLDCFNTMPYRSAVRWTHRHNATNVDMTSGNLANLIALWADYRVQLEVDTQRLIIRDLDALMMRQNVLILAADNVETIARIIRHSTEPLKDLMKRFALSEEQANIILDLTLRRLTRLNRNKIEAEKREAEKDRKQAVLFKKNPGPKVISDLNSSIKIATVPKGG